MRRAEIVDPQETISEIDADPADNRVLEAAGEGRAETIVSDDRHLLALESWRGIAIRSPAALLADLVD